ncbi:hypothetical protein Agub_g4125 [Astrephomene gubernaculifera]|uniref:Uncharacterized protein n=1 Tax=Astrephomene gubernaculifera TaxID=47775 RepID=A0AAD3DJR5_9CHLO|nr:hypothetical protein Agub_g4125 [Astrephomene gubernaculifera]
MALKVNLTLNKTYFLPGEVVRVSVQISNDEDAASTGENTGVKQLHSPLHIKEISFQACGLERTDSSFIKRLHHQEVPADVSDARRQVRNIFSTEPALLINDQVLAPHAVQHFQLRFRLPSVLPPSFRGTAVRFQYLIQVKAVYRLHTDGAEAVAYETTASTSLVVWPSCSTTTAVTAPTTPPGSTSTPSTADRQGGSSSQDPSARSAGALDSATVALPQRELSRTSTAGAGAAGMHGAAGAGGLAALSSGGGALASGSHGGTGGGGGWGAGGGGGSCSGGGDEGDVGMCDYMLGQQCSIRWQKLRSDVSGVSTDGGLRADSPRGVLCGGGPGPYPPCVAPGLPPQCGVIPFGINRPAQRIFPQSPALVPMADTDSDAETEPGGTTARGFRIRAWSAAGTRPSPLVRDCKANSNGAGGTPAASLASQVTQRVQSQLSGGTSGAMAGGGAGGGICLYGSQPSRRGSLFGKVYALNVGDQPLLRLLLQAPLELALQPGATFGGVLDFRPPLLHAAEVGAAASASQAAGPSVGAVRVPVTCHDVAVLLESEEVVAPECRQQFKHDGSRAPGGAPHTIRRLHAEHSELCFNSALVSFTFSLPASATPSFRSPMVALRWVLRFELLVGPQLNFAALDKRAGAQRPNLEQLVWSLPLVVRPPAAV